MTHPYCPIDPSTGQSTTPDASPGRVEVELNITETPAPGWSRLWAWLLTPSEQDSTDQGGNDEPRR